MKGLILAAAPALGATRAFAADPTKGTRQTTKDDNGNFGSIQVKPRWSGLLRHPGQKH